MGLARFTILPTYTIILLFSKIKRKKKITQYRTVSKLNCKKKKFHFINSQKVLSSILEFFMLFNNKSAFIPTHPHFLYLHNIHDQQGGRGGIGHEKEGKKKQALQNGCIKEIIFKVTQSQATFKFCTSKGHFLTLFHWPPSLSDFG